MYLRLVTLASSGVAYPSQETLSSELGLARRDVRNSLRILQEAGFLEQVAPHAVGKHGTVYRPIVRDRCRRKAGDPEVLYGDDTCACGICTTAGTPGGLDGGHAGGDIGGDTPATSVRDKSVEGKSNYTTLTSGGVSTSQRNGYPPEALRLAREVLREVARVHCTDSAWNSNWEELRDALDDQLFWPAVVQTNALLAQDIQDWDAFDQMFAWVENAAMIAGLLQI